MSLQETLLYKMRTLSRYILGQQVAPFLFGVFIIMFILILDFLYKNLEILIGKGVPVLVSLELLLLSMGWMMVMAIPMAVLIATLISFMRMTSDNEIVAMKTGGLSLTSIAKPVLIAAAVLSFLMIPVHNYVVPETNHRLANLLVSIHRKKPALQLRDGVFMNELKGYSILVNKSRGREIEGVTISKLDRGRPAQTIRAERGEIFFAEDICYNHGLLIGPEMVREFLFPYYRQLLRNVRSRQHGKRLHFQVDTDGNYAEAIDLYREIGMDVMSPFEVAAGNDVVAIGRKYPDLVILGGIDKRVLAAGREAIDEHLGHVLPFMVRRGGYVPTCDHGVPDDVSYENYIYYRTRVMEMDH